MKALKWLGAGLILTLVLYVSVLKAQLHRANESLVIKDSVITLQSGSLATLAGTRASKDSLQIALQDARELNGRLLAAAHVHLKPDTVYRDSVTVVESQEDSIRIASIHDTTNLGILNAKITVNSHIGFEYSYIPAPLDLSVALVGVKNNRAVFAVNYRGGTTEVSAPYANVPAPVPFVETRVGIFKNFEQGYLLRGGVVAHTHILGLEAAGDINVFLNSTNPSIEIGIQRKF